MTKEECEIETSKAIMEMRSRIVELEKENTELKELAKLNFNLEKEISELKKICDFNCSVHKLATHNTCLTCPAVRNSPHHDLKNVTDEELQKIIKDAEVEMEM